MDESSTEIIYFVSTFGVAALAGAFRCLRDDSYRGLGHLCAVAGVSGFLGFSVVALFGERTGDPDFNGVWYLGVAAICGLAGKEQTQLIQMLWKSVLSRLFPND